MRAQDAGETSDEDRNSDDASPPRQQSDARRPPLLRRAFDIAWRNAYLGLAVGAVLVVTEAVDFSPPPEVRVGNGDVAALVGDAPPQEFAHELSNPQAVQIRATLRLYPNNELAVGAADPATDTQGKVLSQPVVTTILGMNATVEQTIRLEGGKVEVDLELHATPRLATKPRGSKAPAPMTLEHQIHVRSRRDDWWRTRPLARVHVDARGTLTAVEDGGYRMVFTVDDHLFSLDLESRRSFGSFSDTSLASGQ